MYSDNNLTLNFVDRVAELTDITTLASETDCIPNYISKGISLACFYYARCLAGGHGITRDQDKAKLFYSKVWSSLYHSALQSIEGTNLLLIIKACRFNSNLGQGIL